MRPRLREEIGYEPDAEGPRPKPPLKWAGGKRQIIDELLALVPKFQGRYFEPFVGGGALFFELAPQGAIIGDSNLFLAVTYKAIRDDVDEVIKLLKFHEARHCKAHYLSVRADLIDPANGRPKGAAANVAARVIYLNRTCFNGLWRVNKKGQFNVPMGRYTNPTICDAPNLRACARALKGCRIYHSDFARMAQMAVKGDFVYFDPPYAPVSATANFTAYAKTGFTLEDQERLMVAAKALKAKGVEVLLSNSDVPAIRDLYEGFNIRRIEARRAINSKADRRGAVGELLIW